MTVRVPEHLTSRDPAKLAPMVGLTALADDAPGWSRRRCGRGFLYLDASGGTIVPPERDRLADLVVPPAWDGVWLSPLPDGHLQATGRDEAGRKQYRYHDRYREACEQLKFDRMRYFGRALPALHRFISDSLQLPDGSLERALAAALGTIDAGLLRVGNEQSAIGGTYGASTLLTDHHESADGTIVLEYRSKSGKQRRVIIEDERLSDILVDLAAHDDDHLFTYEQDGEIRSITALMINRAIAEVAGPAFSAKDFRTWGGSRTALTSRLEGLGLLAAVDAAANTLGNTRAVARASYIHPLVMQAEDEELDDVWKRSRSSALMSRADRALLKLLSRERSDG